MTSLTLTYSLTKQKNGVLRTVLLQAVALIFAVAMPLSAQQLAGSALRGEVNINGIWGYVFNQSQSTIPQSGYITTRIPEMPVYGETSVWYQRSLNVPMSWVQPGRSFFLELEKSGHYAAVYVNGIYMGEHYGSFSPFEVNITSAIIPGQNNTINIYVHKADTTYVRPGVNINQSNCPQTNPDCIGNAYRGSALVVSQRNWVGLVGDITFSWRPTENITNVFPVTSVRHWTLTDNLQVTGASPTATVQATVLDGGTPVLTLAPAPVVKGVATLQAPWTNPVLWGPAPYGQPKLYELQSQLIENGQVVDTIYTRFGFREVWDVGKTMYLNGIPMWMVGDFFLKESAVRYINDRRPQAFQLFVLESTGLNMFESHWDDAGRPFLDVADEMGYMVIGAFFCDGRPVGQSQVDTAQAWSDWMANTATEWTMAVRNHPSIVMWRPTDALPEGVTQGYAWPIIDASVAALDSTRPIADDPKAGEDVDTWVENIELAGNPTECDTGDAMAAKLAAETRPLLTREMPGNPNEPCVTPFFNTYYNKAYEGGGAGILLSIPATYNTAITPEWFSISGVGNRPTTPQVLPDWITQQFTQTSFGAQFASLYQQYVSPTLLNTSPSSGDFQASGIPQGVQSAFLVSADGDANPTGVIAAEDGSGTAWFVVPQAGNYQLNYTLNGVDVVQNVVVNAPNPF